MEKECGCVTSVLGYYLYICQKHAKQWKWQRKLKS